MDPERYDIIKTLTDPERRERDDIRALDTGVLSRDPEAPGYEEHLIKNYPI